MFDSHGRKNRQPSKCVDISSADISIKCALLGGIITYSRHTIADFDDGLILAEVPHNTAASVGGCQDVLHLSVPGNACHIVWWLMQHNIFFFTDACTQVTLFIQLASRSDNIKIGLLMYLAKYLST